MEEFQRTLDAVSETLARMSPMDFQSSARNPGINEVTIKALIWALAQKEWTQHAQSEVQSTTFVDEDGRSSFRFADLVYCDPETRETIVVELKYIKPENVEGCAPSKDPPTAFEPGTPYRKPISSAWISTRYTDIMNRHAEGRFGDDTEFYTYSEETKDFSKVSTIGELIDRAAKQIDVWMKHSPTLEAREAVKAVVVFSGPKYILREID